MGKSDVAVIGAGITGLSVAYHLLRRGVTDVTIYDKGGVAAGATAVAPGGVRLQWGTRVNCEMSRESFGFYQTLNERLNPSRRVNLRSSGYCFLAYSDGSFRQLQANVELQHRFDIPSRIVSTEELKEIVPSLRAEGVVGGSYCPLDGYFDDPQAVVAAFVEAVEGAGVSIKRQGVVKMEPQGDGWRLTLHSGEAVEAGHVVMATGYDTPPLLSSIGVSLPMKKEARWLFYSEPMEQRHFDPLVVSLGLGLAIRQRVDGSLMTGWLDDRMTRNGTVPDERHWMDQAEEQAARLVPELSGVRLTRPVLGHYDATPDHQAVLGGVPGFDNLWLAVGMSGHGFMIAPAVGRRIAGLIDGEAPDELVQTLAITRFETGDLVPEPQVI